MADIWRSFVGKRRERVVASIMGHVERQPWWKELTDRDRKLLRDKVLSSIGEYHDVILDLLRVIDDNSISSPEVVRILDLVHGSQRRVEEASRGRV